MPFDSGLSEGIIQMTCAWCTFLKTHIYLLFKELSHEKRFSEYPHNLFSYNTRE